MDQPLTSPSTLSSTATLVDRHLTSSPSPILPSPVTEADTSEVRTTRGRWLKRFTHLPSPCPTEACRLVMDDGDLFPVGTLKKVAPSATLENAAGLLTHLLKLRNATSMDVIYDLLYRGTLPTETIALGILILANLSAEFFRAFTDLAVFVGGREKPEVICLVCVMLAQKVFHDAPYSTRTWSEIVAEGAISRPAINLTERLVLKDMDYQFKALVTPRNLAAVVSVIRLNKGSHLSWHDVKVAILRSCQRGKTTQEASPALVKGGIRPRIEKSGRRALLREEANPVSKGLLTLLRVSGPPTPATVSSASSMRDPFYLDEKEEDLFAESETWPMDRVAHTYPVYST